MKHSKRRQKSGDMLMDVVKYLLTAGFIGGILAEKFSLIIGIEIIVAAVVLFIVAFFTIPSENNKEE